MVRFYFMHAVILAAGKGTRMLPLTETTPKPMVLVAGKPILERIIDELPEEITELIIIIGYRGEQIRAHFGEAYAGRPIWYIVQDEQNGTYKALELAKPYLSGSFITLNADDLHGRAGLSAALKYPLAILVAHHEKPTNFGVVSLNDDGTLAGIAEHPEVAESTLVSTGALVLDERIFEYPVEAAPNGEYYLPKALERLALHVPVMVIEQQEWTPLGYPEDVAEVERRFFSQVESEGKA
jgi:NDP-sugar pyrophosphorylase family protein